MGESLSDQDHANELFETFSDCLIPLGVTPQRVDSSRKAGQVIGVIARDVGAVGAVYSSELFKMAPDLVSSISAHGVDIQIAEGPIATRDAPLGITTGRQAVAETGSVLISEATLDDRSVGLLTQTCVFVLPTESLVRSLSDSVDLLRSLAMQPHGNYASFVTGPSRTADIELSLTLGVQGPASIEVLFVDQLT